MSVDQVTNGVVRPEELYTLDEIKRRLNVGEAALRAARRAGLSVHYKHGRGFVLGRDWIDYVRSSDMQNGVKS